MENAEEVMQILEEFSKIKPKDIPRELEDYLSFVAKTGDPVYQWPLVKTLFREKLIGVISDFYESTPTVELPPCPNVDPFNYERQKTFLIERLDSFSSAPFTVQRMCELLTCPKKEYNRVDKYMRAIEKNILVVSTCEPGMCKRPYDSDGQSETILNGMPDVKINEADGSLLHLPTDLPYLGAPPASNDVTVETSEPNSPDLVGTEKVNLNDASIKFESKELPVEVGTEANSWQESTSKETTDKSELNNTKDESEADISTGRPMNETDCDTSNRPDLVLPNIEHSNQNVTFKEENQCSSDPLPASPKKNIASDLPDSIGSSDPPSNISTEETKQMTPKSPKIETKELIRNDENEVSSTPADDMAVVQDINDPADSEAEATGSSGEFAQKSELDVSSMQDDEVNSRIVHTEHSNNPLTISEVTVTKSEDIDLECNEITGTVESPVGSPENKTAIQKEDILQENLQTVEEVDQCLHPDSSNDVSLESKISPEELKKSDQCSEADSMSHSDSQQSETRSEAEDVPEQNAQTLPEVVNEDSSSRDLGVIDGNLSEVCTSKNGDDDINAASKSSDSSSGSEDSLRDERVEVKLTEVKSSTESKETCEKELKHFEPVTMQLAPDSQQKEVGIEEISVDPPCEIEEEAMEVDEGSNQMTVSEGENEGEPMDQGDQHS